MPELSGPLAFLAVNGALYLSQAVLARDARTPRAAAAVNGTSNILLALIGWFLWRKFNVELAIGVAIAGYTAAAGWQILMSPRAADNDAVAPWFQTLTPTRCFSWASMTNLVQRDRFMLLVSSPVWRVEGQWLFVAGTVLFVDASRTHAVVRLLARLDFAVRCYGGRCHSWPC